VSWGAVFRTWKAPRDNSDVTIVGREHELAAVQAFLEAEEWPRLFVLAGEAGIGKTTLWRAAVEEADSAGYRVLATRPLEAEAKLAHAALGDLLAESHDALAVLPEPQARALRAALLLETPASGAVDERAVSLGFLGVLRALADEQPVLLAVDDVQWLDAASGRVLAYAARRLAAGRVAILLAVRSEARAQVPFDLERLMPALTELEATGLTVEDLYGLLRDRLGLALSRPALRELHDTTQGNPYFALELGRTVARRDTPALGGPAPLPPTLRDLTEARVSALPAGSRDVLAVAAALSDPTVALAEAATGIDAVAALGPAIEQEVVALASGRIRFVHPLLSSAAYAGMSADRRRDVHAALAALVDEPEERARHLALAAAGPDAEIAAALDEAASLARARGAPVAAAELLEEARVLTPAGAEPDALRRAVAAAGHYFEAGDARRARVLLDEAMPKLRGVDRARALITLARLRSYDDDIYAAVGLLEDAIAEAADEPLVAARAQEILSGILFRLRERFADALDYARAAAATARAADDVDLFANSLGSQLLAEATLGVPEAHETLAAAIAIGSAGRGTRAMGGAEFQVAVVQLWWERLEEARHGFQEVLAWAHEIGDESSIPYCHVLLAQTECLRGALDVAAMHAEQGAVRAEQVGQQTLIAYSLSLRALAAAYAGDEELARTAGRRALELADSTTGRPAEQFATAALGLLEVSLERPAEAVDVLAPLAAWAHEQDMREPGMTRFIPDFIEALVVLGRLEEAEEHAAWYAANAEQLGRRSALGAAARCRGLLAAARGDTAAALASFEEAVAHHRAAPIPFDLGRSLLALGAARRRAKERRAAREALGESHDVFRTLGATIWERRASAELGRIGGRAPSSGELTPVERRVAELVAAGRSNKEIAGALYLSTRTVEGHLSRVYGKLGVHSRVELTRKLG
jgi:DNA-binding CsgD family transcriptional regulator